MNMDKILIFIRKVETIRDMLQDLENDLRKELLRGDLALLSIEASSKLLDLKQILEVIHKRQYLYSLKEKKKKKKN